jgi:hypothetical protein
VKEGHRRLPNVSTSPSRLVVSLPDSTLSVSALYSLLRESQAAVRNAATNTPAWAEFTADHPDPVLQVMTQNEKDGGLRLEFYFTNPQTREPLDAISELSFTAFMGDLQDYLKSQGQRTFWGEPARPAGSGDESTGRSAQVWAELSRVGVRMISTGARRIELSDVGVEII